MRGGKIPPKDDVESSQVKQTFKIIKEILYKQLNAINSTTQMKSKYFLKKLK